MHDINRAQLIEEHHYLAADIAAKYKKGEPEYDEQVLAESEIGLAEAANHFMRGKGRFTSYAPFWIKRRLDRFVKRETQKQKNGGNKND